MSANLLDLAKGYLTNEIVDKASSFLGEDASTTQSAFDHILPALLGGMVNKASDKSGASDLFGMVTRPEFGGGLLNNLGDMFSNTETANNTLNLGGSLLSSLLGGRSNNIIELISSAVGMKSGSTSNLLKMALPIILSVIGKKVKTDGLGLDGFMNLISGQEEFVKEAAPAGFLDKMMGAFGVSGLAASVSDAGDAARESASDAADRVKSSVGESFDNDNNKSGFARFLPILLIIGALILAWMLWKSCDTKSIGDDLEQGVDKVEKTAKDASDAMKKGAQNVYSFISGNKPEGSYNAETNTYVYETGEMVDVELPNGETISVSEWGAENTLFQLINSDNFTVSDDKSKGWFTLDGVNFETGSATLTEQSHQKLENIAAILSAYPNVHLKFGGYTDNVGGQDVNQPLSAERATSALNKVVSAGVDAARLAAEGYGQEHPICPANDTDACKAQNRRVDVRITQK